jgi:integrase
LIARYEREILPDVPVTTRDTDGYWLPNLLERFGRMKFAKNEVKVVRGDFLRRMHVQAYLTECAKTRPVAVNCEISTLRKIFRYAQSWGLTEFNPCMDVRRNVETPRDAYISDAILLTIYQKAHPVLQCIIDIAQMFGCRPGEARGLRDDDILDNGVRLIPLKSKRGQPNKPRIYSWSDDLVQVIARSKQLRAEILTKTGKPDQPFLFLTPQGEPYNKDALVRVWSRTVERAGYDSTMFHLNDIRAKTGSDVYAAGNEAVDHLDHTDSRATRRVYDRLPRKIAPVVPISSGKRRTA